jgi:hypothetical protein
VNIPISNVLVQGTCIENHCGHICHTGNIPKSKSYVLMKVNVLKNISWDISGVTNFASLFSFATSFNHNVISWNVSSVKYIQQMSGEGKFVSLKY